jgi:diguanylate cyclase (GGDEF)-like protein
MKILIADDDPISRTMLERLLVQWSYDVTAADDGDEALWILQKEDSPRLAILDWMMPGKDGVELCREVRKQMPEPYTYILLLTAKTQKEDLIEGLQAGADDYLSKPFDPDELRVRLRAGRRILELQEHLIAARDAARFPSTHDMLTGLWNREAILAMLRRELAHPAASARPVSITLVDIDYFKSVNATYGHLAGDLILREVARRTRSLVRVLDSVGRYAGAEFLIVSPDCAAEEALVQARQVCACIGDTAVDILGGSVRITASLGVATSFGDLEAGALVRTAEESVRWAKSLGRARAEAASAAPPESAERLVRT